MPSSERFDNFPTAHYNETWVKFRNILGELKISLPLWNRLEPRSRTDNFSRGIQACIFDPYWMLARQWQMGEFKGEDAGTPIKTNLSIEKTKLTRFSVGASESNNPVKLVDVNVPLETTVEQEHLDKQMDWRSRVQIGQQFERELKRHRASANLIKLFKEKLGGVIPDRSSDDYLDLDDQTWKFQVAVAGKMMDGQKMKDMGLLSKDPVLPEWIVVENDKTIITQALNSLWNWYKKLQPWNNLDINQAWRNDRFEYEMAASAPRADDKSKQHILVAHEYRGGDLGWYDFNAIGNNERKLGPEILAGEDIGFTTSESFELMPKNICFKGMPNARWWQFEDRKIDFGNLDIGTADIGKLLVMEFALIYGNDWFIVPVELDIGSICKIKSVVSSDVFGTTTVIKRAGSLPGLEWQKAWNMFSITIDPANKTASAEDFLFLPPSLGRTEVAPLLEDVRFLRDEMANICFAVEHTMLNGMNEPILGYEYHRDRKRRMKEQDYLKMAMNLKNLAAELGADANEVKKVALNAQKAATPQALFSDVDEAIKNLRGIAQKLPSDKQRHIWDLIGEEDQKGEEGIVRYRLASVIPENWIPYVPVQTGKDRRSIQFRQAAMANDEAEEGWSVTRPETLILKSAGENHFVNEEAISRAGTKIALTLQRTRWIDGSTHIWIGRKIGPGLGEGRSGLQFDYLDEK